MMNRFSFAFLIAGACSGCVVAGERAAGNGTGCPTGETCSSATPQGLYFQGPTPFYGIGPNGPLTVAVGGTEKVTVLATSNSEDTFDSAFDAAGTSVIQIDEVTPPDVQVSASAAGKGYLRILQKGTDKLLDRVEVLSAKAAKTALVPSTKVWVDTDVPQNGWAVFAGATVQIGAQLHSASDAPLVDQSMKLVITGAGTADKTQALWDVVKLTAGASGDVLVTATLGDGTSFSQSYPVVASIDEITRVPGALGGPDDAPVAPEEQKILCFRAKAKDLVVVGAPWKLTSDSDVVVEGDLFDSCALVSSKVVGKHTVTVSATDKQISIDFEVVKKTGGSKKIKLQRSSLEVGLTPGERSADF